MLLRRAPARAQKRGNSQIEEHRYNDCRRDEFAMVRSLHPAQARAPDRGQKDDDRKQKEDAGDFQPEGSAYTSEWAQKPADALHDAPAGVARHTARALGCACSSPGAGSRCGSLASNARCACRTRCRRRLLRARKLLSGDAAGYA